jgi:hypothetical protein
MTNFLKEIRSLLFSIFIVALCYGYLVYCIYSQKDSLREEIIPGPRGIILDVKESYVTLRVNSEVIYATVDKDKNPKKDEIWTIGYDKERKGKFKYFLKFK